MFHFSGKFYDVKEIKVVERIPRVIKNVTLIGRGGYNKMRINYVPSSNELEDGRVSVRVKACGMNFSDLFSRQGIYCFKKVKLPFVMGVECSGIIEQVAPDVSHLNVGDRVVCWSYEYGMWTELASVPQINCMVIPETMSFEEAVAFPFQYVTAYLAILDFGHLKPGQSVFVQSIGGGVGWAATQMAKLVDNVTIIGTASAIKHDSVKENGVHYVIDYGSKDLLKEVKKISPKGIDVVLDCLAGSFLQKAQSLLKPMGKIIAIGMSSMISGEKRNLIRNFIVWFLTKKVSFKNLITRNQAICGINVATLMEKDPAYYRDTLAICFQLYTEGKLKPKIDSTYSFEEVVVATKRMVERKNVGKIVLVPSK